MCTILRYTMCNISTYAMYPIIHRIYFMLHMILHTISFYRANMDYIVNYACADFRLALSTSHSSSSFSHSTTRTHLVIITVIQAFDDSIFSSQNTTLPPSPPLMASTAAATSGLNSEDKGNNSDPLCLNMVGLLRDLVMDSLDNIDLQMGRATLSGTQVGPGVYMAFI